MLYLLLKVASSVGMGLLLKQADARRLDRLPVVRINYVVAAILAFLGAMFTGQGHISLPTAILAVTTGCLFVAGLLLWVQTISTAGLALSVVAMRTAIAIPAVASIIVWHERPTSIQLIGIAVALAAVALVLFDVARPTVFPQSRIANRQSLIHRPGFWLAALFLVEGLVMLAAKIFRERLPQNENLPFQSAAFLSAAFVTTILYYLKKPRVTRATLSFGALLGVANLGNYLFLILALAVLPGVVVYPVIAAAEVGLLALAGALVWKERVGVRSWLGIALAVAALILIQLGKTAGT